MHMYVPRPGATLLTDGPEMIGDHTTIIDAPSGNAIHPALFLYAKERQDRKIPVTKGPSIIWTSADWLCGLYYYYTEYTTTTQY